MIPKILHLNYFDNNGGAARAAYRLHRALLASRVNSNFIASISTTGDWTVKSPTKKSHRLAVLIRPQATTILSKVFRTKNQSLCSPAVLPSRLVNLINHSDADVVHLHWIANEMISISDIGRIEKPIVWTLHDMWSFCGAEHLATDARWREGYRRNNRPMHESGFDLNRWTWERKIKHWKRPMHIITPSSWLGECARESLLMKNWPITVIPNCLDTDKWRPIRKDLARALLNLPADAPLILFGTSGGNADLNKGFDLMLEAIKDLRDDIPDLQLVIFGQLAPRVKIDVGVNVHYLGHLHDDLTLRVLYSAVNVMLIPSRLENLPNTGLEALSCGTPVAAFDTGGMRDVVLHQQTGYLAKAFDARDFARGIKWILSDSTNQNRLSLNARREAVERFNQTSVVEQYLKVYRLAQAV